jgi:hypothetical protein
MINSIHGDPNLMPMPLLCRKIVVELRIDVLFNFSNNDDDDTFDASMFCLIFSIMMMMILLMGRSANYNFLMSSLQQTILDPPSLLLK